MKATTGSLPKCVLVSTGGTIAMKLDPNSGAPVPALSGEDLLQAVPALRSIAQVEVVNFANLPSPYMGPSTWRSLHAELTRLLAREDIEGVVVSHGTDTLEETAWFLDLTLRSQKPVVLTGAQRNASDPDPDGPRNLLCAVRTCITPAARDKGVLVVLNNQINSARDVTKTHTSNVDSFKSGEFGFLGTVEDSLAVFQRSPLRRQHIPLMSSELPRVDIVPMYAGADGSFVWAARGSGARGIVVQALGLGNVNAAMYEELIDAVRSGIVVAVSSRVPNGRVRPAYGFIGGGATLREAELLFAGTLSPQKARILLMLALQAGSSAKEIQNFFDE